MKTVTVRGLTIGSGIPKVIVPIARATQDEILRAGAGIFASEADAAEWRADFYENANDEASVLEIINKLRAVLGEKPLIFTFRTQKEGGARITERDYAALCAAVLNGADADIIDVEAGRASADEIIAMAHRRGRLAIASYHDFGSTPPAAEIVSRLERMRLTGADIIKIAVMPKDIRDVLSLLEASAEFNEKHADRPFIAISMGPLGMASRVACEAFGSAMTFAALGKESAPGQPPADGLIAALRLLHARRSE